jgi:hypothetical protein
MLAVALSQLLKDVWDGYGGQTVFVISGDVAVYNDAASNFLLTNLDSPSAAFSGASILSALNASNGRHVAFICNIKQMYQNFASIAYNALRLPTIFVYTQGDKVKQYVRTRSSARELPQDYMKYTPLSWQAIKAPLVQSSRHPYGAIVFTGPSFQPNTRSCMCRRSCRAMWTTTGRLKPLKLLTSICTYLGCFIPRRITGLFF